MNLLFNLSTPENEMKIVELYLRHSIRFIESSAYTKITPALVFFRVSEIRKSENGLLVCNHHILGKCSRPEIATMFMTPTSDNIINRLVQSKKITEEQAIWAKRIPHRI